LIFAHEFLEDTPKAKPSKSNITRMNKAATSLIESYNRIENILLKEVEEDQKDTEYFKSVLNAKFN
jgi:hypothetical protein